MTQRKILISALLAAWAAGAIFCGCAVKTPTTTLIPTNVGTVVVNDACTGSCAVNFWLDNLGPYVIHPGTVQTIPNVAFGNHNLTFNTTAVASCGSGPVSCYFCCNQTGVACELYLQSNSTIATASLTDNGCNVMNLHCSN